MSSFTTAPTLGDLHADAAAFLAMQRPRLVGQPHLDLQDLGRWDDRLEANLDAMRIARTEGFRIDAQFAEWQHAPGEMFVATVLAAEYGHQGWLKRLLPFALETTANGGAFVSAMAWLRWDQAEPVLGRLWSSADPAVCRIVIAGFGVHRRDPGRALNEVVESPQPEPKARALKAIGELKRRDLLPAVRAELNARDHACRFYAGWSGALLGEPAAVPALCGIAEAGGEFAERACAMAVREMKAEPRQRWIGGLAAREDLRRAAMIGAGAAGDPACVPRLLDLMHEPAIARVAGEAFTTITGADLAQLGLEGPWPEGFVAGPTEDPEDENVELDPDENLPWPDRQKVAAWWDKHRREFEPGTRYLLGRPLTTEWLEHVLRFGYQRQRAAAAVELAIRNPDQPLFEVRAPGFRQQEWLGLS